MDQAEILRFLGENNLCLNISAGGNRLFDVVAKDKDIDIVIHDLDGLGKLIKELRKWKG
jgi:hypothetical protein